MADKNKKGSMKVKTPNALSWFKNVGKSLGYTSMDLVNEMMPATIDFGTSNLQTVKDVYTDLRSLRTPGKRIFDVINKSEYANMTKSSIQNAIDDIKSGKIYNKERQEKIFQDGNDEFGMSDFNLDDTDGGSETEAKSSIKINNISGNIDRNNPMVTAVDRQTQTLLRSTQATNELGVSLATTSLISDRKIGKGIMQGLDGINNNLSLLVNFQSESMTKYISASLSFYEANLKVLGDTLLEIQKSSPQSLEPGKRKEDPLDSALLSRGGLNLKGYGQMVIKQLGNSVDSNMFLSPIKSMLQDKDTLKFLAASPLSFISTKIVTSMIPSMLKSAMVDMDKSFQGFFPAMLMKINRLAFKSDNPIMQLFGQVFGVNVKTKSSVDMSKYNKGPVSFDGYVKKAITDVIPNYLRKILSALTGKEEIGFDYEKGVFKTVYKMDKEFKDQKERTVLNQFNDAITEVKDRANSFYIEDVEERRKFYKDIDKFFLNLAKTNHLVNPTRTKDKDGNRVDELADVFKFNNTNQQEFFRQLVLSLPKNMQMQMFGRNVIDARKEQERFMLDAEENPLKHNAGNIFNEAGIDGHLTRDPKDPNKFTVKKGGGLLPTDAMNFNTLDYLRDIKRILLHGIVVFPKYSLTSGGDSNSSSDTPQFLTQGLNTMRGQDSRARRTPLHPTIISTDSQIDQRRAAGQQTIESLSTAELGPGDFSSQIGTYVSERDRLPSQDQGSNIFKWAGKFMRGDTQDRYNMLREKISDVFSAPVKLLTGVFKKIDTTMYEMVFGKVDDDNSPSFFSKTLSSLKTKFEVFTTWMKNDIFLPIKNALFGPDGFITKLKNNEMFTVIKGKLSKLVDYLFGNPTGENGARQDGLFSQSANSLLDIWDGAKYYFTGKGYTNRAGQRFSDNNSSVMGELKSMFSSFKGNLKEYLFGKNDPANSQNNSKGVFSNIINGIGKGFQNFSDAMFGPKTIGGRDNENYFAIGELNKKIKARAPKALAIGLLGGAAGLLFGGKLGLLGSLVLPGGPIGGAVVATTLGFLSQSDRFKSWLFGPKDVNGSRIGGFISKNTVSFLTKNKVGIVGGASLGALKSTLTTFGILPSFFLPGGIVGGAILGVGTSLLLRSERFQNLMFGEKNEDGKRQGGVVDKLFGQFRKGKNKNLFGNIGAGAIGGGALGLVTSKFGLMGAMMLPGGPIGGALLGAAAGIALSSDKWKKALFGEFDQDTQLRKGGLFGKFINWTKLEVLAPLKLKFGEINLNIQKWFGESIANPFMNAIEPLKHEMKLMIKSLKDTFVQGWKNFQGFLGKSFEKFVGKPFGQFMNDNVLKPLKSFLNTLLGGIGKIFGPLLSAPVKVLEGLSTGLMSRHKEQGVSDYRKKRGFLGSVKDAIFNRQAIEDARNSTAGAPYARELEIAKANRAANTQAKYAEKKALLDEKWAKLNIRRGVGLDNNYENFDKNGNPIPGIYRTHDSSNTPIQPANVRIVEMNSEANPNIVNRATSPIVNLDEYRRSRNQADSPINQTPTLVPATPQVPVGGTRSPHLQLVPPNTPTPVNETRPHLQVVPPVRSNIDTPSITAPQVVNKSKDTNTLEIKPHLMTQMAADIKIIAQEVKGQLDGVGSNVFKIRKLLQKQSNIGDEDLTGNSNRDRIGFLGKIKRALYKPFDTAKELLMKPIRYVGEKLSTLGNVIKNVGKAIVKVPVDIVKGVWSFGKELLNVGKETFLALVKLPLAIVKTIGSAFKIVTESLKIVGPAIGESLKGVAKLFTGAMGLVSHSMIGFGKGVGEILLGFGQGIGMISKGIGVAVGKAISGTVDALFKMVPLVTDFMFGTARAITDFTLNVVTTVGQKLLSIGDSLFQIVTSPIKFLAGAVSKMAGWKSEVVVAGGTLDLVKEVRVLQIDSGARQLSATGTDDSRPVVSRHLEPMSVRIVSSDVVPVRIVSSTPKPAPVSISDSVTPMSTISSGIDQITNSMLGAMNIFDNNDDREEADKRMAAIEEAQLSEDQKQVSRRTASFTIAQNQARADKEFIHNNETTQTSLLSSIAESVSAHKNNWLDIFGKKGLITALALIALPYLKKLFNWFLGKKDSDNNGGNVDEHGNPITDLDTEEHVARGVGYGAKILGKKVVAPLIDGGKKVIQTGVKVGKAVVETGGKIAQTTGKVWNKVTGKAIPEAVEQGAKGVPKVVSLASYKAGKEAGKTTAVAIQDSAKLVDDVKNTQVAKVQKTIQEMMSKLFTYLGEKCPAAKKGFSAISATVAKVFTKEVIAKTLPKWLSGIGRIAGSALSLGIMDATWVTYGLVTGWFEATHLFKVHSDQIDYIMRSISSAMKGILNFSWFFLINIANDVFVDVTQGNSMVASITGGTGFLEMIANYLYSAWAGELKGAELSDNQSAFEKEREQYNLEKNTTLTPDEYNALKNPTVLDKVVGGAKKAYGATVDGAKYAGSKISEGMKYIGDGIANNAKYIANNTPILGDIINNDTVKSNLGVQGNGTITTGMRAASGIAGGAELILGIDSEKTAKTLYGIGVIINESIDNNMKYLSNSWDNNMTYFSNGWDNNMKYFGNAWDNNMKYLSNGWDNNMTYFGKAWDNNMTYLSNGWDNNMKYFGNGWDNNMTYFGNAWDSTMKYFGIEWDNEVKYFSVGWDNNMTYFGEAWDNNMKYLSDAWDNNLKYITTSLKNMFSGGVLGDTWNKAMTYIKDKANKTLNDNGFTTGGEGGFGGGGGFGEAPSTVNNFSYFSQADDRWANVPYDYSPGKGKSPHPEMEKRGCGPTSAAMVVSQLTGNTYTPPQMAKIAQEGGHSTNQGTSWSYFKDIANKFNMETTQIDPRANKGTVKSWLDSGVPIILSGIRPGTSSVDSSPFTSAGHFVVAVGSDGGNKVMINDPRGEKYSHAYDINTVLNESKQAWGFKYGGGPVPTPNTVTSPTLNAATASKKDPFAGEDLFMKLSELMGIYAENVFFKKNDQLSWGTDETGTSIAAPTSPTGASIDFLPKNLQDAILKKTVESTIKYESGGNYTFAKNDINGSTREAISPSIGALQWRGGHAKTLMQNMAKLLPNNSEADYFANKVNWGNNSPWSSSEQTRLQNFLSNNYDISKKVEDEMALSHVRDTNLSQVYKYGVTPKKISDPRSIVFLGDFANTGPGLISPFLSAYSPTSQTGKSEFQHLYNEFKTKSYWGRNSRTYSGRMERLYSDLIDWDPEQGGYGPNQEIGGGFGELTQSVSNKLFPTSENSVNQHSLTLPSFTDNNCPEIRSYMNGSQNVQNINLNDDLLIKAIQVLQIIATNTNMTSDGVKSLSNMKIQVDVTNQQSTQPSSANQNTVIVTPTQNNNLSPSINTNTIDNKQSRDYEIAKSIARGRII